MKIQLKNVSEYSSVVSARYLLDTYLGESSSAHFYLSTGRRITSETELVQNIPDFIVSPVDNDIESGLQIMTSAPGITTPERVILANWKRLNDSNWRYSANTQRTFSSPPYSINDSACALYYEPRTLSRGQVYEINIALGSYVHTGFSPDYSIRDREISSIGEKTEESEGSTEDRIDSIQGELSSIEDFLNQIDVMLESGEEITEEKLYLLEQIIRNLEDKKSQY